MSIYEDQAPRGRPGPFGRFPEGGRRNSRDPPVRRDDTADIVMLLAMVVKLQTGIDEVGRQRQQRLRKEFVPSMVEQLAQHLCNRQSYMDDVVAVANAGDAARLGVPPDSRCRSGGLGLDILYRWCCAQ